MEIKVEKDTGRVIGKVVGNTSKGRASVTFEIVDAMELSRALKGAAFMSNRVKKINAWDPERREAALARLGI